MDEEQRKQLKQQAKSAAAKEAEAMAQREAERDEAQWKIILDHLENANAEQRHVYVAYSNYDDNERGIRFLADCPELSTGTAVMMFWFLGADYLARMKPEELRSYQQDKWQLLQLIEQRVVSGFYKGDTIHFDPADSIVRPGEYESMGPLVQPIAPQMYAVARGTDYVDLDEAAENYDDGLPMDVSSAVWALWDD